MDRDKEIHHRKRIPLAQKFAARDGTLEKGALLTNCYREPSKSAERIVKRPGYRELGSFIDCTGQGMYYFEGDELYVACDTLWVTKLQPLVAQVNVPAEGAGSGTSMGISVNRLGNTIIFGGGESPYDNSHPVTLDIETEVAVIYPPDLAPNVVEAADSGLTSYAVVQSGNTGPILFYDKDWVLINTYTPTAFTFYIDIVYHNGIYYAAYDGNELGLSSVTALDETGAVLYSSPGISLDSPFVGTDYTNYVYAYEAQTTGIGTTGTVHKYDLDLNLITSWDTTSGSLFSAQDVSATTTHVYVTHLIYDGASTYAELQSYTVNGLLVTSLNIDLAGSPLSQTFLSVACTADYVVLCVVAWTFQEFQVYTKDLVYVKTVATPVGLVSPNITWKRH